MGLLVITKEMCIRNKTIIRQAQVNPDLVFKCARIQKSDNSASGG